MKCGHRRGEGAQAGDTPVLHRPPVHLRFAPCLNRSKQNKNKNKGRKFHANRIRVCTYDGPGAQPVIRTVPWPKIPKKAALIKVGACGVCGTDLHILKGHWPKPLPWPFTLGHEIGGVLVEVGSEFKEDFMSKPLTVGSKVMIPPLMPCGQCYYCIHYPAERQQVPDAGLLRPLSRLRQGAASVGRLGRICLCRSRGCCRAPRSTSCPTTCRCGWARCRSR